MSTIEESVLLNRFVNVKSQTYSVKNSHMRSNLSNLARECDRHGVSDRAAAALASAVLADVGIVHNNDSSLVIDRSKVRREIVKGRKQLQCSSVKQVRGLYFDGRKDKTRVQVKTGKKSYPRVRTEGQMTLVREPNSHYLDHLTPASTTAKDIHSSIVKFLLTAEIETDGLVVIGCDGTNVNTGSLGGVIRLTEIQLGRPVHWFICMLHNNELPLRHLIQKLDGGMQGVNVFLGDIGKALMNCELQPVVYYSPIGFDDCSDMDDIDLSTDQQYLYDICKAVASGNCSSDLALKKSVPVCHSRWLTTANRLLRLYVSTESLSDNLVALATYARKVWICNLEPVWFQIKTRPACSEGSRHLWRMIKYSRYLEIQLRDIVDVVI